MGVRIGVTVNHAVNALNRHAAAAQHSIEKLSSGRRVVRAADDVANLGKINRFTVDAAARGVAVQNANSLINVLQIADQTLADTVEKMNKMRTLLLQAANGTVSSEAKVSLQNELASLLSEINRGARGARYGSNYLMAPEIRDFDSRTPVMTFVDSVQASVSSGSAYKALKARLPQMITGSINRVYGTLGILPPSNTPMTVTLQDDPNGGDGEQGILATGGGGMAPAMTLVIDVDDFLNLNGGTATVSDDSSTGATFTPEMIVVHEMVHAVTATIGAGPGVGGDSDWGNHILANWVSGEGGMRTKGDPAGTSAEMADGIYDWAGSSSDYTQNALIGQFLAKDLGAERFERIIRYVQAVGAGATLWRDAVLSSVSDTYAGSAALQTAVQAYATDYINNQLYNRLEQVGMGWTSDFDGGTPGTVIQSVYSPTADRIVEFNIPYATAGAINYLALVDGSTSDLAQLSLATVDEALESVAFERGQLGAQMGMLQEAARALENEQTTLTSALSSLADVDTADEITEFTRRSLLTQSSTAFLAQAQNLDREIVLGLLT
ncbi:MAG: flagellin [Nitrospirae bacterium]|nr:flagellin [Nitrospirota bacterium]